MRVAFVVLLVTFLPILCWAEDGQIFEPGYLWDAPEQVSVGEQELVFTDYIRGNYTGRAFNYHGLLDDGMLFFIHVVNWRYGILSGWGVIVTLIFQDGTVYVLERSIPARRVTVVEDSFSLHLGDSFVEGSNGVYRIRLSFEDFSCDLRLSPILPPWKPGNSYAYLTPNREAFSRFGVPSPWAKINGTMEVGGSTIPVNGQCYGDRTLHCYPIRKLNSPTYYFRAFSPASVLEKDRWLLSTATYNTHPSYGAQRISLLILAHGKEWIFSSRDVSITPADFTNYHDAPYSYPARFLLWASTTDRILEGEFIVTSIIHYSDIFERLPKFSEP